MSEDADYYKELGYISPPDSDSSQNDSDFSPENVAPENGAGARDIGPQPEDDASASSPEEPEGFDEFPQPSKRGKVIGKQRAVKAKLLRATDVKSFHPTIPLLVLGETAVAALIDFGDSFKSNRGVQNLSVSSRLRLKQDHLYCGATRHNAARLDYMLLHDEVNKIEVANQYVKGKCLLTDPIKGLTAAKLGVIDRARFMPADTPDEFVLTEKMFVQDFQKELRTFGTHTGTAMLQEAAYQNSIDAAHSGRPEVMFPLVLFRRVMEAAMCTASPLYLPTQLVLTAPTQKMGFSAQWKFAHRWPMFLAYIIGPLEGLLWQKAVLGCVAERVIDVDRLRRLCREGSELEDLWRVDIRVMSLFLKMMLDSKSGSTNMSSKQILLFDVFSLNHSCLCICVCSEGAGGPS
jgi:hypothetical protein